MSEIFDNAITSITLGIEDYQTGTDARMLSAARNYYAGLLLLAKECLVCAAPEAEIMHIIGVKFKPVPDEDGGIKLVSAGYTTVDLAQLQIRFKDFKLAWPDANIKKLQQFRNDLEHYHLKEPASALSEAIASSFPMVVDFFQMLEKDPRQHLAGVWKTILAERAAFEKVQKSCLNSLEDLEWPAPVEGLDKLACPNCQSSLIGQSDPDNLDRDQATGKCFRCGAEIAFENLMEMVVAVSYEVDSYLMVKDGLNPAIVDCPECMVATYIETGEISVCFACGESVAGECLHCTADIGVHDSNPDYPNLCGYCAHISEKLMQE